MYITLTINLYYIIVPISIVVLILLLRVALVFFYHKYLRYLYNKVILPELVNIAHKTFSFEDRNIHGDGQVYFMNEIGLFVRKIKDSKRISINFYFDNGYTSTFGKIDRCGLDEIDLSIKLFFQFKRVVIYRPLNGFYIKRDELLMKRRDEQIDKILDI